LCVFYIFLHILYDSFAIIEDFICILSKSVLRYFHRYSSHFYFIDTTALTVTVPKSIPYSAISIHRKRQFVPAVCWEQHSLIQSVQLPTLISCLLSRLKLPLSATGINKSSNLTEPQVSSYSETCGSSVSICFSFLGTVST